MSTHVMEVVVMRIELVKRPQHSALFSALSPFIALGLTLIAGAIMFSLLGKNPLEALYYYFIDPLTARSVVAARAGHQGGAADPDRGRALGLLPLQQLEHRRGRPVHRRRHRRLVHAGRVPRTSSPGPCCR